MNDFEIIDELEKVRAKNNINWMNILRLAFKNSPEEAREIIFKINQKDNQISKILEKLSKNKSSQYNENISETFIQCWRNKDKKKPD